MIRLHHMFRGRGYSIARTPACSISTFNLKPVIGLEFHAQIASSVKLFSPMTTNYFGRPPNTLIAPFDLAVPGTMPVLQFQPVVLALATAVALNCTIPLHSRFDRKHYNYPDLPLGFQITQKSYPLAVDGFLRLGKWDGVGAPKHIRIQQLHLEQDTGKLFHNDNHTLIDYNRAGVPLMEIVTHPDITSSIEAGIVVKSIQRILRSISTCDANLEEGSLRVDVNISMAASDQLLHPNISTERVEIKNVSTISGLVNALDYEIHRQSELLRRGDRGQCETRGFDASTKTTYLQRSKETAKDYRYIHDTEIPAITVLPDQISRIRHIVEARLPNAVCDRLAKRFPCLSVTQINWLVNTSPVPNTVDHTFDLATRHLYYSSINDKPPELTSNGSCEDRILTAADYLAAMHTIAGDIDVIPMYNWLSNELMGRITAFRDAGNPLQANHKWGVCPEQLVSIVKCISNGRITGKAGKRVLDLMVQVDGKESRLAQQIAADNGWLIDNNIEHVQRWVLEAIRETPRKAGVSEKKYVTWLTGQVMKLSKGKADPLVTRNVIHESICTNASS